MKKGIFLATLLSSSLLFTACIKSAETTTPVNNSGTAPAATEKSGDTVKTGVISEVGGIFMLKEGAKQPIEIESYAVDLSAYVGQTVTVTGQYSGDTLFVGSVE